jgi:hypothetical protein
MEAKGYVAIFEQCILDYHLLDDVKQAERNAFSADDTLSYRVYEKAWVDVTQWHLEDIIRDPMNKPETLVAIKREIDRLNQKRTDLVEKLDDLLSQWADSFIEQRQANAFMCSESLGWMLDRLSILCLKIYHMREQTQRTDVEDAHRLQCQRKLDVLLEQQQDLCSCYDNLCREIEKGTHYFKVYRQMKMYNDPSMNPFLAKTKA